MKKNLILFIFAVGLFGCSTSEPEIKGSDCLVYSVTSETNKTAALVGINSTNQFGDISIASTAQINGKSYNVTSVADEALFNCRNITSVTLPNNVKSTGYRSFQNCYKLSSVILSNSLDSIGDESFHGCDSLKNILLPNSLRGIGRYAFKFSGLNSIIIPSSVKTISEGAFWGCNLKKITIYATTPPYASKITFDYNIPLYVPNLSLNSYKNAIGWKDFKYIIGM